MGGFDVNLLRYKDDASTADLKTLIVFVQQMLMQKFFQVT